MPVMSESYTCVCVCVCVCVCFDVSVCVFCVCCVRACVRACVSPRMGGVVPKVGPHTSSRLPGCVRSQFAENSWMPNQPNAISLPAIYLKQFKFMIIVCRITNIYYPCVILGLPQVT